MGGVQVALSDYGHLESSLLTAFQDWLQGALAKGSATSFTEESPSDFISACQTAVGANMFPFVYTSMGTIIPQVVNSSTVMFSLHGLYSSGKVSAMVNASFTFTRLGFLITGTAEQYTA